MIPTPTDPDERAFLDGYDAERFQRPSVTVDVALVTLIDRRLAALLIQRAEPPQKNRWSLPGGFVRMEESLDAAAARVLSAKADVRDVFLEQLFTFGAPRRDPRTRVISVAYYALVPPRASLPESSGGARWFPLEVPWEGEAGGPIDAIGEKEKPLRLAFDHAEMLGLVVKRLRGKLDYADVGYELLPTTFTLRALQDVHETILGRELNKDSFRRRMLATGRLEPTGRRQAGVGHRPAALYRCVPREFS